MQDVEKATHDEAFIVRISDAGRGITSDAWRATVVHVATGERRYVSGYAELCSYIESVRRRRPAPG